MGLLERLFRRIGQSDEDRLSDEVREWAESVPETLRIETCGDRAKVRVAGVVRRIRLQPAGESGDHYLQAAINDGTGEITAVWMGRDEIPGLRLGTRVVLEGLAAEERGSLRIVNPRYEFA